MTEPEHIPLSAHDRSWVDWLYDSLPHPIRKALEAYEAAHDVEESDA